MYLKSWFLARDRGIPWEEVWALGWDPWEVWDPSVRLGLGEGGEVIRGCTCLGLVGPRLGSLGGVGFLAENFPIGRKLVGPTEVSTKIKFSNQNIGLLDHFAPDSELIHGLLFEDLEPF